MIDFAQARERMRSLKKDMERIYVFQNGTDLGHYQAELYAIRCVDDRFWKTFKGYLKSIGVRRIDPKTPAGAGKVFASPEKESDRDYNLRELAISVRLHRVKRVFIFNHHDCGAYGGIAKFDGDEDRELKFHAGELRNAREVILEKFPDLEVEMFFIDRKGVVKIS